MKEKNFFLVAIATTSRKDENEITAIYNNGGMVKLMDEVILPIIVRPTGQDIRGWYIGDDFMALMAMFGEFISQESGECYDILAEIAMQRLSCGAVLHEPISVVDTLPVKYRQYSTYYDQRGLMTQDCWDFYEANAKLMWQRAQLRDHAERICRGIITQSDENGRAIGDYMWGSECKTSLKKAREFCCDLFDRMELYEILATPEQWPHNKIWLSNFIEPYHCWDDFFSRVCTQKGFFRRLKEKREIKKAICGRGI